LKEEQPQRHLFNTKQPKPPPELETAWRGSGDPEAAVHEGQLDEHCDWLPQFLTEEAMPLRIVAFRLSQAVRESGGGHPIDELVPAVSCVVEALNRHESSVAFGGRILQPTSIRNLGV
jgi:hypothetical protein